MLKRIAIAVGLICVTGNIFADTTTVSLDSGSKFLFDQNTGVSNKLSGGTIADGDGTVLQLGYYSAATTANNFAGNWVPLTGEMSLNTAIIPGSTPPEPYNKTSVGDLNSQGGADGAFFLPGLNFVAGSPTSGNSLPPANTPLSIRFYNGTTLAGSTFYNAVSNDLWLWKTPATPPVNVNISLDDPGLEFYSIFIGQAANTAFHTTVPFAIPEPSTYALLGLGAMGFFLIRRQAKA